MAFDINTLTPEQILKGMACKSLDEFKAYVEAEGFDLDEAETQAIFEEMYETELSDAELMGVAGGKKWCGCDGDNECKRYQRGRYRKV